jgi:hypothetical protein
MPLEKHWFSGLLLDFDGTIIDSTEGERPSSESMLISTLTLMPQRLKKIGNSNYFPSLSTCLLPYLLHVTDYT